MDKKRTVTVKTAPIIWGDDLSDDFHPKYGISIYDNIIIVWDEDYDVRIYEFIDQLEPEEKDQLVAVKESDATLCLLWKNFVPEDFNRKQTVDVANDIWKIEANKILGG